MFQGMTCKAPRQRNAVCDRACKHDSATCSPLVAAATATYSSRLRHRRRQPCGTPHLTWRTDWGTWDCLQYLQTRHAQAGDTCFAAVPHTSVLAPSTVTSGTLCGLWHTAGASMQLHPTTCVQLGLGICPGLVRCVYQSLTVVVGIAGSCVRALLATLVGAGLERVYALAARPRACRRQHA